MFFELIHYFSMSQRFQIYALVRNMHGNIVEETEKQKKVCENRKKGFVFLFGVNQETKLLGFGDGGSDKLFS